MWCCLPMSLAMCCTVLLRCTGPVAAAASPHLALTSPHLTCRLPESLAGPLAAARKAARLVGNAAADAKLGINVDEFVERFR